MVASPDVGHLFASVGTTALLFFTAFEFGFK